MQVPDDTLVRKSPLEFVIAKFNTVRDYPNVGNARHLGTDIYLYFNTFSTSRTLQQSRLPAIGIHEESHL